MSSGWARVGENSQDQPIDVKLTKLDDGSRTRLSDYRGKPLLLDLWATWCLPCREQAAVLGLLEDELAQRDVTVLAIDMGEKKSLVEAFLKETPNDHPVLLDRAQVTARVLDIEELPVLALLDADGRVLGLIHGLADRKAVLELLDSLPSR